METARRKDRPAGKVVMLCALLLTVDLLLVLLSFRQSLMILCLPTLAAASIVARRTGYFRRAAVVACLLSLALAAIPVDVTLRSGRYGFALRPILWGDPTREAIASADRGEIYLAGCVTPLDPARKMLVISF